MPEHFLTWLGAGLTCLSYGLLALLGGVQGYVRKGSKPSLIAGGISGLLLIACAVGDLCLQRYAAIGAIIVSLLLIGRFAGTLVKERRVSGGVFNSVLGRVAVSMVVLGLVTAGLNAIALWSR